MGQGPQFLPWLRVMGSQLITPKFPEWTRCPLLLLLWQSESRC